MKKFFLTLAVLLTAALFAGEFKIVIQPEKPSCIYQTGENAVFQVQIVDRNNQPAAGKKVEFLIVGEKGFARQRNSFVSTTEPYKLQAVLAQPGSLRILLWFPETPKKRTEAGAVFAPEKIFHANEPADFDEFWAKELAAIKSRSSNMKITNTEYAPPKAFQGKVRCFDIRIDDGVLAATGVLVMPVNARKGKHPLIMTFNGASKVGASDRGCLNQAVSYNSLVFNMNIHDTANNISNVESRKLWQTPEIHKYYLQNADSVEKYGTGIVFRRVMMMREYLKTLPEWDGETIIARGGSMGGAQAIVASAWEPKMKLCVANAPAMCDHLGFLQDRTAGWPGLFREKIYAKGGEKHAAAMKTMPYFDVASFAKRVKCPVSMAIGFIDYTCPPSSIYAAYNNLGTAEKTLVTVPRGDHGRNLDPASKAPGVFGYGGSMVQQTALKAYRAAMGK